MKSEQEIVQFEKLAMQLEKMLLEFSELSKKKPNDAVNKFKLGLVNSLLDCANLIVDIGDRPFKDFLRFDEDSVPSNSDVLVILSQYRACLERLFSANTGRGADYKDVWRIKGKLSSIPAPSTYHGLV